MMSMEIRIEIVLQEYLMRIINSHDCLAHRIMNCSRFLHILQKKSHYMQTGLKVNFTYKFIERTLNATIYNNTSELGIFDRDNV